MAMIPDQAIDEMATISSGAFRLYCYLCRCRNHKTGRCFPSTQTLMESIGVNRSSVFALRKELVSAGWVTMDGGDFILIKGFNSPENQTMSVENSNVIPMSLKNQTESPKNQTQSENSDSPVQKIGLTSPENQTEQSKKSDSYIGRTSKTNQQREPEGIQTQPSASSGRDGSPKPKKGRTEDPLYLMFVDRYEQDSGGAPYQSQTGDFVQMSKLRERCAVKEWELTAERWQRGLDNYFSTPIGTRTLADFCVRFSTFYRRPLDRFKMPVQVETPVEIVCDNPDCKNGILVDEFGVGRDCRCTYLRKKAQRDREAIAR